MKFITLTRTERGTTIEFFINCDKIHLIIKHWDATFINLGNLDFEFKVDQTPEEIMELINECNK